MPTKTKKNTKKKSNDIPLDNIPERKKWNSYTDEFKTTAAKRVIAGETVRDVATELGIPAHSSIEKWVKRLRDGLPISETRGGYRHGAKKTADPLDLAASTLRSALDRATRARDDRLEAAALIVEADAGGREGVQLAKAIRAHIRKPRPA